MEEGYSSLKVYKLAYQLALEINHLSKSFPKEEIYSLTDQIRRSSRSVCTNIGEAYRKRKYPRHFSSKITDADGECTETMIWLNFSKDFNYISVEKFQELYEQYQEIGRLLGSMSDNPDKFFPKK